MSKSTILIIEDDPMNRVGMRILLEGEGYQVMEAESGEQCLELLNDQVELVLLDVMMPGMGGLRTCEEIRKVSNVPVLFITAKSQESDKLVGLMAGGDDYLTKPFSYSELLGRVKALLRRYTVYQGKVTTEKADNEYIEIGGISLHKEFNEIYVDGDEVSLSDIEYKMLRLMMENRRKIFSAQNIYESVWGEPYFYSCNGTIMVHIRKIRQALGDDPKNPTYLFTVWGKGYRFDYKAD